MYAEIKSYIQTVDAQKVKAAEAVLAQKKVMHRDYTRKWMQAGDELTQTVAKEEIDRLVAEIACLQEECVPFLVRYREKVKELKAFRERIQRVRDSLQHADIDARARSWRRSSNVSRSILFHGKAAEII